MNDTPVWAEKIIRDMAELTKTVNSIKEETIRDIAELTKTVNSIKEETIRDIAELTKTVNSIKEETSILGSMYEMVSAAGNNIVTLSKRVDELENL